ncbi:MAG: hypothetical protein M1296_04575 [Chloroflexi bacterium]|nr:hypothetical protein [Chloroflexota bacterium]
MTRYRARWSRPDPLPGDNTAALAAGIPEPPEPPQIDHALICRQLEQAEIVACEPLPSGSNYSFAVGLSTSGHDIDLIGIYKPRRGEAPLWDFPNGSLYRREFAAYRTSQALGWTFIPPTVVRDGPYGAGTVQLYIEPNSSTHYPLWRQQHLPELSRLAVFDYVTNNADRKASHCLLDKEGTVWGIDHGLTFHEDVKLRTVIREFTGLRLCQWLVDDLEGFYTGGPFVSLAVELEELISKREVAAFRDRLERILRWRVFPMLDLYDSVPREWW